MNALHAPLIQRIRALLQDDPRVVAAWLEGAIARGEEDDFSDIDLWIAVRDDAVEQFVAQREQCAAQVGPVLSVLYPALAESVEGVDTFQVLFEDQPSTLTLDVSVQAESCVTPFDPNSIAEECVVLFDKGELLRYHASDPAELDTYVVELYDDLSVRFWHALPRVLACVHRGDLLEAMDLCLQRVEDCVTLFRMRHAPAKVDWGWKDVEYDLPEDVVRELYSCVPELSEKSLRKKLSVIARLFLREQKALSREFHRELPEELIHHVMNEV